MGDILGRQLLAAVTAPATGAAVDMWQSTRSVQASVTGGGAVSATVIVEVSNDGSQWLSMDTITLSGTSAASGGFAFVPSWRQVRARATAVGVGSTLNVTLCG